MHHSSALAWWKSKQICLAKRTFSDQDSAVCKICAMIALSPSKHCTWLYPFADLAKINSAPLKKFVFTLNKQWEVRMATASLLRKISQEKGRKWRKRLAEERWAHTQRSSSLETRPFVVPTKKPVAKVADFLYQLFCQNVCVQMNFKWIYDNNVHAWNEFLGFGETTVTTIIAF